MKQEIVKSEGYLLLAESLTVNTIIWGLKTELEKSPIFESAALAIPDLKEKEKSIIVKDEISEKEAISQGMRAKEHREAIEGTLKPLIQKANDLHKGLTTFRNEKTGILQNMEKIFKSKVSFYKTERERKRQEEIRKREAEARAKEEEKKRELEERAVKWDSHETETGKAKAEQLRQEAEETHIPFIMPEKEENITRTGLGKATLKEDYEVVILDEDKCKEYLASMICAGATWPLDCLGIKPGALKSAIKANRIETMIGVNIRKKKNVAFQKNKVKS